MAHKSDSEIVQKTHNTSRFFVETRQLAWVLLIATCIWGTYGYFTMPQRKDPEVAVRMAVALTPWPGASAEKIEQLVTKKIEEKIAENSKVTKIESISRTSISVVYVELDDKVTEVGKEFDDISLKLNSISDLPENAGPINFIKDFGDTAALMLTVASPKVGDTEIRIRARDIRSAIEAARAKRPATPQAFTFVYCYPASISPEQMRRAFELFAKYASEKKLLERIELLEGSGFMAFDSDSSLGDIEILNFALNFVKERMQASEFHPDAWQPMIVRDPAETEAKLRAVGGDSTLTKS